MICASAELRDGGNGIRFTLSGEGHPVPAFAVRHGGKVYAYVNRCRHVGIELDLLPGRFFDDDGLYLICATHGAAYMPDSGACVAGPCRGARLRAVPIVEREGAVMLASETLSE